MERKENYQLINGTFTTEEANTLLTKLFNYKIDFHNREDFSNHIRFNRDLEHSKKRINELNKTKDELTKIILENKDKNVKFRIEGVITIDVENQDDIQK